ncbi:MAG: ABC transporter permease, partial [Hydrogenophaga sp.]|nr:ABC transporter permease [Hydrogenophaga sp.]
MSSAVTVSFWGLGWRALWRDARAGELRLLILAVALAVAALSAVGFFADRLQGGLARDAKALIGGDAVLRSDGATPPPFIEKAQSLGLLTSQQLSFPTMARAPDELGGAAKLVSLKSVDDRYPLRGQLRVADAVGAVDVPTREVPARGTAWVDAALRASVDLHVGQSLWLGDAPV